MSQNEQPQPDQVPKSAGEILGEALQAFANQVVREATQLDSEGNQRFMVNLPQLLIDVRTLEVKLQCIFEELGKEQLIDPAKLLDRTVRKFEFEARHLKQVIDARPKVAIAHAVGINGRNHG